MFVLIKQSLIKNPAPGPGRAAGPQKHIVFKICFSNPERMTRKDSERLGKTRKDSDRQKDTDRRG
jgi:hypothetical protein